MASGDYWGSSEIPQIPALGALYPMGINVAECIVVSGTTDGVPTATSDSGADFMLDTQELFEIFNIEGGSDSDGPGNAIWVTRVLPIIVTAFTASVTMHIGDTGSTSGWAEDTAILATATDLGLLFTVQSTADYAYNVAGGVFYPSSTGTIEVNIAGADAAAGRLAVYALYFQCKRSGGY